MKISILRMSSKKVLNPISANQNYEGEFLKFTNNRTIDIEILDRLCIFANGNQALLSGGADDRAFRWKLSHFKIFGNKKAVGNGQKDAHACDIVIRHLS